MNLHRKLQQRAAENRPVRIGLIGAGKFGSMYLAQIPRTPGVHLVGIADLSPANARVNLARVGWADERLQAKSLDEAVKQGTTHVGDDWKALVDLGDQPLSPARRGLQPAWSEPSHRCSTKQDLLPRSLFAFS